MSLGFFACCPDARVRGDARAAGKASVPATARLMRLVAVALLTCGWLAAVNWPARTAPRALAVGVVESASEAGVWEVTVSGQVVIRIRAGSGGMSAEERARAVSERLRKGLEDAGPEAVKPAIVRGSFAVAAGDRLIVTVDPQHGTANGSSCYDLALRWANNIRAASGVSVLSEDGAHLVSLDGERGRSVLIGRASWYGARWHGRPTATGEVYDQNSLTAAHRTLPFGTLVRVTNLSNGKQVTVRINNRGPYIAGRDIDLSKAAAEAIDLIGPGVAPVAIEILNEK
ncbi:MAG: septal ring lytic transglycosylase RlpA family protein [Betaproteobacteria bacterium]